MANNGGGPGFTTGFLLGGIIGVMVGLLIAPKTGEEIRSQLAERSEDWRHRAEELAAQARERLRTAVEEGKSATGRFRHPEGVAPEVTPEEVPTDGPGESV